MSKLPRLLCIEPDVIIGRQYEEFFANKYQVTVVHDAQAAIVAADAATPDVIVLEVVLARHSGIEFLYEFRSYVEWQQVPVVILSRVAESDLGLTSKAKQDLSISQVLYKPHIKLAKLADILDSLRQNSVATL